MATANNMKIIFDLHWRTALHARQSVAARRS
jgi:hypothetical protein